MTPRLARTSFSNGSVVAFLRVVVSGPNSASPIFVGKRADSLDSRLQNPAIHMVCSYCGLPTDGGQNHGTTEQCVRALDTEARRLRGVRERAPSTTVEIGGRTTDAGEADEELESSGG